MEDCYESMDTKTKCCCVSTTVFVVLTTILTAMSFGAIEPTQYGILYHKISKSIDEVQV
jgi:SPFH domain / Band 7 family